ncbi:hypothetical protein NE237_009762 [Protea cynaroides]|uniref:Uncharacterized protein n=1 Tax=Protea cynaroides TaxID=273540 RepID=A0A9Q0KY18_9MAGN|nr:hypothetical protein NE237_009762 [Protea cynaroides]
MATDERAGAEIVYGKEACDRFSAELMKEIDSLVVFFPRESWLNAGGENEEDDREDQAGIRLDSVAEMCIDGNKITFKTSVGVRKSFPLVSFMNEEEKKAYQYS